jgi:hypothetical protein
LVENPLVHHQHAGAGAVAKNGMRDSVVFNDEAGGHQPDASLPPLVQQRLSQALFPHLPALRAGDLIVEKALSRTD